MAAQQPPLHERVERSSPDIAKGVLQAIYAVFLGLLITAVVGVGVYTFHPSPSSEVQEQINDLYQERGAIDGCGGSSGRVCRDPSQLTEAERAQIAEIDAQIEQMQESLSADQDSWAQTTSIVLIVIATALLAISLAIGQAAALLGNGVLLGGLFTMLYGVGWGVASGDSVTRFVVLLIALVISVVLGYLRFGRRGPSVVGGPAPQAGGVGSIGPAEPVGAQALEIVARIEALEARLDAAAQGMRGPRVQDDEDRRSAGPSR